MADGAENTALGDVLGITEAALDTADPVSLGRGYLGAMRRAAFRRGAPVPAVARYGVGPRPDRRAARHPRARPSRCPRSCIPNPATPRFRDPTWQRQHLRSTAASQSYLLTDRACSTSSCSAARPRRAARASKAEFAASSSATRCRPPTSLLANPRALKRAFETGGTQHRARRCATSCTTWCKNDGWPQPGRPLAVRARARTPRPRRARSCSATS